VSFILKDTSSIQEDPSGSIRIDCGDGSKALQVYWNSVLLAASIQVANRPLKTGCIGVIILHTAPWNSIDFHHIDPIYIYRIDPALQGIDSVALAALIQQAGPLIRLAGNSCIGIFFPYSPVEFSRRIHSTGCFYT